MRSTACLQFYHLTLRSACFDVVCLSSLQSIWFPCVMCRTTLQVMPKYLITHTIFPRKYIDRAFFSCILQGERKVLNKYIPPGAYLGYTLYLLRRRNPGAQESLLKFPVAKRSTAPFADTFQLEMKWAARARYKFAGLWGYVVWDRVFRIMLLIGVIE